MRRISSVQHPRLTGSFAFGNGVSWKAIYRSLESLLCTWARDLDKNLRSHAQRPLVEVGVVDVGAVVDEEDVAQRPSPWRQVGLDPIVPALLVAKQQDSHAAQARQGREEIQPGAGELNLGSLPAIEHQQDVLGFSGYFPGHDPGTSPEPAQIDHLSISLLAPLSPTFSFPLPSPPLHTHKRLRFFWNCMCLFRIAGSA